MEVPYRFSRLVHLIILVVYADLSAASLALNFGRKVSIDINASIRGGFGSLHSKAVEKAKGALRGGHGSEIFAKREINQRAYENAMRTGSRPEYKLTWLGNMVAGAFSRSIAQVALHPFNVVKTLLQTKGSFQAIFPLSVSDLTRGAGAQFILSLPMGAFNFAVLECTKQSMTTLFPAVSTSAGALLDFISSSVAITVSSVMSTPTMVLTSRIMTGTYPNLVSGIRSIAKESGIVGFYAGWIPGLVQKIPSYGLTWVFFQQAKNIHYRYTRKEPSNAANFWLGCIAAAGSVIVMIPMDTVKTRLVTQTASSINQYTGIMNCFRTILRKEGLGAFYNSLTPRLISVVPMIGLQYGILCFLQRKMAEGCLSEGLRRQNELMDQEKNDPDLEMDMSKLSTIQ